MYALEISAVADDCTLILWNFWTNSNLSNVQDNVWGKSLGFL